MALESVTHISDLVTTNPTTSDGLAQGDDHIRNIKTALKTDFPNINGVVNSSVGDLNAIENFEETVSSTTSEVTIKTGKTLNIVDDGAGLEFGGVALSTPVATLNLVKGMIVLDTPELITSSPVNGVWTTVNNTTLNTAQASAAIIRTDINCYVASNTYLGPTMSLRKTGSGLSSGDTYVCAPIATVASATALTARQISETVVNLDTNYDFDYYYFDSTATIDSTEIYLIGYYI